MIVLLGSLLGFLGSLTPEILKLFTDKRDKAHEIKILQLQLAREEKGLAYKLEAIETKADSEILKAVYQTYHTGIRWVDALNGTVRPVIAYGMFLTYAAIKIVNVHQNLPWLAWTEEDMAILGGILSFYFGNRSLGKMRGK